MYVTDGGYGPQLRYKGSSVMAEYKTKAGRVLTDADMRALADEAERGYDVEGMASFLPEPEPCDHRGGVLRVGDRVCVDTLPERLREPDVYGGTVMEFEWDERGLHARVLFGDGTSEWQRSFATREHGELMMEFGDLLRCG